MTEAQISLFTRYW